MVLAEGMTQMFTNVKLASILDRVKPELELAVSNPMWRADSQQAQAMCDAVCPSTSTIPTARCGPARRVVWEGRGQQ